MDGDSDPVSWRRRRAVLHTGLCLGFAGIAGCLGSDDADDNGDGTDDGQAHEELVINGRTLDAAFPIRIYVPDTNNVVTDLHFHEEFSHWHREPLTLTIGDPETYEMRMFDDELKDLPIGPSEAYRMEVTTTPETPDDLLAIDVDGELVTLVGETAGDGSIDFDLIDNETDKVVWSPIPLVVTVED